MNRRNLIQASIGAVVTLSLPRIALADRPNPLPTTPATDYFPNAVHLASRELNVLVDAADPKDAFGQFEVDAWAAQYLSADAAGEALAEFSNSLEMGAFDTIPFDGEAITKQDVSDWVGDEVAVFDLVTSEARGETGHVLLVRQSAYLSLWRSNGYRLQDVSGMTFDLAEKVFPRVVRAGSAQEHLPTLEDLPEGDRFVGDESSR
ncbi:MAG: hypothetical protein QM753_16030 [Thermomicrobiales bacterium]